MVARVLPALTAVSLGLACLGLLGSSPALADTLFLIPGPVNGAQGIGTGISKITVAQTLSSADILSGDVQSIRLLLRKQGNPTDDVIVTLRSQLCVGSDLASGSVPLTSIPSAPDFAEVEIAISNPVPSASIGAIVLSRSGSLDGSNFPIVLHALDDPYSNGQYLECGSCGSCTAGGRPDADIILTLLGDCNVDCDDQNPCTVDSCDPEVTCAHVAVADGEPCDDNDACTQHDECENGACEGSDPVSCEPIDQCHLAGSCDPSSGTCSDPEKPLGSPCDDGDPCTLGDSCDTGACQPGEPTLLDPLEEPDQTVVCVESLLSGP